MREPEDYKVADSFTGGGDTPQLTPDGYVCIIKNARETTNNGIWAIELAVDIAEGNNKGFYAERFAEREKSGYGGGWPCIYRQSVTKKDSPEKTNPFFKGLITSIEESNPGYTFNFDEKTLVGKLAGFVFGQEEFQTKDGEIKVACKPKTVRTVQAIREGKYKVPEIKKFTAKVAPPAERPAYRDISDSECPF